MVWYVMITMVSVGYRGRNRSTQGGSRMPSSRGKKRVDIDEDVHAAAAAVAEQLHVSTAWLVTQLVREGLAVKRGGAWQIGLLRGAIRPAPAPAEVDDGMEDVSAAPAARSAGNVPGFKQAPKRAGKRSGGR